MLMLFTVDCASFGKIQQQREPTITDTDKASRVEFFFHGFLMYNAAFMLAWCTRVCIVANSKVPMIPPLKAGGDVSFGSIDLKARIRNARELCVD